MPAYYLLPLETAERLRDRLLAVEDASADLSPNGYKVKEVIQEMIGALLEALPEAAVVEAPAPGPDARVRVKVVRPGAGSVTVAGHQRNSGTIVNVSPAADPASPVRQSGIPRPASPAAPAAPAPKRGTVLELPEDMTAEEALAALARVGVQAEVTDPHPVGRAMDAAARAAEEHPVG